MRYPAILKKIRTIEWMRPVISHWPLMLFYIILIGWLSVTKNPFPRWMIIFLHAYIVAAIITITKSRIIKGLAYLFIYLLFLTELVLSWLFGMHISPAVLVLIVETNGRESAEFLEMLPDKPDFWFVVVISLLLAGFNIAAEFWQQQIHSLFEKKRKTTSILRYIAIVFLVIGVIFSTMSYTNLFRCKEMNEVDEWRSHMRNPNDAVTMLMVAMYDVYLSGKEMEHATRQVEQIAVCEQNHQTDSINIILVIGESFIREHSPLYGYPLNTTPFLCQERDSNRLFVFTDVVTPYNQTTKVIRNMLSCNSLGNNEHWASLPPLTAVFKRNGYWVSMQDNQKNVSVADVFGFSLNTYLYHPRMMEACYHEVNESSKEYDGEIVEDYKNLHKKTPAAKRLLLFHLMGQHENFENRYPKSDKRFNIFSTDNTLFRKEEWLTDDMRQMIASYDNATIYNDYVLKQIIQLYEDEQTVVIYTSDHGEEVYDYRPSYGRDSWELEGEISQALRYQYCIPFMVWCSDKYRSKHPEIVKSLKAALGRPLMIDNTCHLMFTLAGLSTPYYEATRDILSDNYHCPPRIINDKVIYDSIISQH